MTTSTQTRDQAATTFTIPTSLPTQAFRTVPDWAIMVLALYLFFAPIWASGDVAGWFTTLGMLLGVTALGSLVTASSQTTEWLSILVGIAIFFAPWFGGFSTIAGSAWTAWLVGILSIALAYVAMVQKYQPIDN